MSTPSCRGWIKTCSLTTVPCFHVPDLFFLGKNRMPKGLFRENNYTIPGGDVLLMPALAFFFFSSHLYRNVVSREMLQCWYFEMCLRWSLPLYKHHVNVPMHVRHIQYNWVSLPGSYTASCQAWKACAWKAFLVCLLPRGSQTIYLWEYWQYVVLTILFTHLQNVLVN